MHVETITSRIDTFIAELKPEIRARVIHTIELLQKYENNLGMPYSKSLGKGLFELRVTGRKHVRLLYCFHNNTVYLLAIFQKKTNKITQNDIVLARRRMKMLV